MSLYDNSFTLNKMNLFILKVFEYFDKEHIRYNVELNRF